MDWWKDGISANESRISALVLTFIPTLIFALVMYALHLDFSDNLLWLLTAQITGITGVNFANRNKNSTPTSTEDYDKLV